MILLSFWQAALLLLFNGADRLSYSEIVTQLNLSDDDVVRLLHSLSCAKYKILNKEPANRSISPNDVFEFNSKFTDRMRRIKVFPVFIFFLFRGYCQSKFSCCHAHCISSHAMYRFPSHLSMRRKKLSKMLTKTGGMQLMRQLCAS